ncbi:MAG TPA: TlpA disulfide reductase family protein [Pyrinomonadaceae bacterium]|nr:TlpA disulfide reductase family protein [Pyrinomonadaceae bacterium]
MTRQKKYKIFATATLICGLVLLASCNATDVKVTEKKTPVVSAPPGNTTYPMPPLEVSSINNMGWTVADGKRSLFSEYRGKVLILDYYATWCNPCRKSIPHLVELQKKHGDQGLQVIGLNVGGPEDLEKVPGFARELNIQYPLAVPDDELVSFMLSDIDSIPQTFVFDREGVLVERVIGFGPSAGPRIDSAVENALKASAP